MMILTFLLSSVHLLCCNIPTWA